MMPRRVQRVGEQLKREISGVLRTDVHDPRVSGVTVTSVEVSPDLALFRYWRDAPKGLPLSFAKHVRFGTIEAIRIADAPGFALGVQWHAEYDPQKNAVNRALFQAFGEAVSARKRAA